MKQLKPGFSLWGLIVVVLVMLPNALSLFITAPNDVLAQNEAAFWLWNVLENIGRFGVMLSLVFLVDRGKRRWQLPLSVLMLCFLAAYYACWGGYFYGITSALLLLGLAVFPTLFFLLSAIWLRNAAAVGFSLLFGAVHIAITAGNYFPGQ